MATYLSRYCNIILQYVAATGTRVYRYRYAVHIQYIAILINTQAACYTCIVVHVYTVYVRSRTKRTCVCHTINTGISIPVPVLIVVRVCMAICRTRQYNIHHSMALLHVHHAIAISTVLQYYAIRQCICNIVPTIEYTRVHMYTRVHSVLE